MKLTHKLNLILVFLLCFGAVKGQSDFRPGFIITNDNDTLKGLIDYRGDVRNAQVCNFKLSANVEAKDYLPGEIKAYHFENSKYYVSKKINSSQTLFLELLVDGIADLYFTRSEDNSRHFYIQKNNQFLELTNSIEDITQQGRTFTHERKEYIGKLKIMFSDAPQLYPTINQMLLEAKPLMNVTRKYHDYVCDSAKCIIYQKQAQKFKFRFAPFISMNSSVLSLYNVSKIYSGVTFQPDYYPTIGLQMSSPIPWTNEKITLQASAEIGKLNFSGSGVYLGSTISEEVNFQPVSLTGKLGLKYTYPTGKIRPTIMAGGTLMTLMNTKGKRYQGRINPDPQISITQYEEEVLSLINTGFYFDLGLDYHFSSSRIGFINFGYSPVIQGGHKVDQFNLVYIPTSPLVSHISTASLKVGLYF